MRRWFVRPVQGYAEPTPSPHAEIESINDHADGLVPYDENLLERARTQWQFGDWASLIKLERDTLQHHPDRAKLALLTAAGYMQQGDMQIARQFTRLAQDWGCSKKLVSQILIAGVHNSLGRASAANGESQRALQHFEFAIAAGAPASEIRLLARARNNEQLAQMRLPLRESNLIANSDMSKMQDSFRAEDEPPESIVTLVDQFLIADDVFEEIDRVVAQKNLNNEESFFLFVLLSDRFRAMNDNVTALSFLNSAREQINNVSESLRVLLAKKFIELAHPAEATDIIVQSSLSGISERGISDEDKMALEHSYKETRISERANYEHGHELLYAYLRQHLSELLGDFGDRRPILIEIGTTRENIPGQGSTRKLAEFCMANNLHFITVDMDPHNTHVAADMFRVMESSFQAINMKGEEYLRDYDGNFDFIFLDAYDFDHGKHSALRQSRYQKFLGASINDVECHKMHLDCAKYIAEKLSRNGVVCIDDTWLEDGRWTAKGTLAMPYLLENGFCLLEARNRAALLGRFKGMH